MNFDPILVLIIVVPILLIITGYLSYLYYLEWNKTNKMIRLLASDTNKILEEQKRKQRTISTKQEDNWLVKKLRFAGFDIPFVEYYFIAICLGFGFLSATFINFVATSAIVFVSSFAIFSFFPLLVLKKIVDGRREEFNFGLKVIIDKVTSMMKSGVGFEQALNKSVLTSKSKFTKEVFSIYLNEKDIIGEDKTFEKMFKVVDSKELRIFYLTVSIGRQSGGKFSNTLEKLRKTLHDQGEIKQEITASTKEIKIGTYMIIGMVVSIYYMMNSSLNGVLNEHFFYTDKGKIQMFFIIVWIMFGIFINNMLSKIKA